VTPGTDEPAPDDRVGEVVVTTLSGDYPLLRFGTGDLSAWAAPLQDPLFAEQGFLTTIIVAKERGGWSYALETDRHMRYRAS
jgi:hypothetical protein